MMRAETSAPVLVVMLKMARVGQVKTRLAQDLGAEAATAIYRRLVERQMAALPREWAVEVHYAPADAGNEMERWLGARPSYHPQSGEDLGERLIHGIAGAFARGATKVLVIGGDCPGLDEATLRDASTALTSAEVVLGPAPDGGYYLVGLRQPAPDLFRGISWSSSSVLTATLSLLQKAGLSHVTLAPKEDVDDLASWQRLAPLLDPLPAPHPP